MRILSIVYSANESGLLEIHGSSDCDYRGYRGIGRFTIGYLFTMVNGLLLWKLKKKAPVALSSMATEYNGLTEAM